MHRVAEIPRQLIDLVLRRPAHSEVLRDSGREGIENTEEEVLGDLEIFCHQRRDVDELTEEVLSGL